MGKKDSNTEQAILDAAEKIFLSKGYASTKTTEIAKLAGVNHAMLHYYFRTKENLFNKIFEQKAALFAGSFGSVIQQDLPFLEIIRLSIEAHFDFLKANPKLPIFIFSEIMGNEEKRDLLKKIILPKVWNVISGLQVLIDAEVAKGKIIPINSLDLILNIVSLNVFVFISAQVFIFGSKQTMDQDLNEFLQRRKNNNIHLILKGLEV